MTIRWRLGLLFIQLAVLLLVSNFVTGQPLVGELWFFAGLLAVVVNPQLLEPWYPRPQDVLVNGIIALALAWTAEKSPKVVAGWSIFAVLVGVFALTALLGLALGAGREEGRGVGFGRAAARVSRVGSAAVIYSGVFWLAAVEFADGVNSTLWTLGGGWLAVMLLGHVNWETVFASATNRPAPSVPEGMVGPSILRVSGNSIPGAGKRVKVAAGTTEALGTVVTRIQRTNDAWAEIFVEESGACERFVQATVLSLKKEKEQGGDALVGSVDAGSSNRAVEFVAVSPREVGSVVAVPQDKRSILYQISSAYVERSDVRGGAHLITKARGVQLGEFDRNSLRIRRHPWVPPPGAPVSATAGERGEVSKPPDHWHELGTVIGTDIPVFLDLNQVCEGHLVVLGMTRMGKTTLAVRIAEAFARRFRVTLVDQTGEYVGKRGFRKYKEEDEDEPGVSVFEPKPGETPADRTLNYLEWLVEKATTEYAEGDPPRRIVMLEEAHQFVPEPAGLGFGAPGRDSAYRFGTLMMQVRKYGITIVLISQRTAVVAKSALSQCENVIAFKSVDKTGLDYLETLAGSDARNLLPSLEQGQALVFGPGFSTDAPVAIQVHH